MDRRQYLATVTALTTATVAGCSGDDDASDGDSGDRNDDGGGGNGDTAPTATETVTTTETATATETVTPTATPTEDGETEVHSLGESVTYGGLEISATDYMTTNQYTTLYINGGEKNTHTARDGAIFVFVNISIRHVGETELSFPTNARAIELTYKEEPTSSSIDNLDLRIDGDEYSSYTRSLREEGADVGVFPGTSVQGWVGHELPENFERNDAILAITWINEADELRTFRWRLGNE